jgi:hypothetical protein
MSARAACVLARSSATSRTCCCSLALVSYELCSASIPACFSKERRRSTSRTGSDSRFWRSRLSLPIARGVSPTFPSDSSQSLISLKLTRPSRCANNVRAHRLVSSFPRPTNDARLRGQIRYTDRPPAPRYTLARPMPSISASALAYRSTSWPRGYNALTARSRIPCR